MEELEDDIEEQRNLRWRLQRILRPRWRNRRRRHRLESCDSESILDDDETRIGQNSEIAIQRIEPQYEDSNKRYIQRSALLVPNGVVTPMYSQHYIPASSSYARIMTTG